MFFLFGQFVVQYKGELQRERERDEKYDSLQKYEKVGAVFKDGL